MVTTISCHYSYAINLNYGWFKRQKRRLRPKPTLYLQNTPPFFNIKDSRGIPNTIRNTKSVPPGSFKPSPIIHEAKKYPEHFTNPKFPKFPKLPEYPVSRPQHGYSKLPSSLNELPKHEFPSFDHGNRGVSQYHHGNYPKLPPLNNGESGHISDYTNGGPNVPHYHSHVPSFMKGGGSPFKNNHPKLANPGQLPENIREFLPDIPIHLDTDEQLVPTSGYHSKGAKSLHFHDVGGRGPNVPDYHSVIPSFMKGGTPFKNNHRLPSKLASNSNLPDNIREFLPDVPTLNTDDHLVPTTEYHSKGGKLFGHHHHSSEPEVPHYHSVIPSFSKNTAPFREKHPGNSLPPLKDIPKGIGQFKLDLPKVPHSFDNGGIPGRYQLQGGKLHDPNRGLKNSFGNQLGFKNYANSQLSSSNGFDNYKVHHKRQILPDEGRDTSFPKIPAFEHQDFGFKNSFSHIESIADNFKQEVPKYGDHKPPHQPEYHQPEYHEPEYHPPPKPHHHELYQPPKKPNFKPPSHQPYKPPKKPNFKPPRIPFDKGTSRGKNQKILKFKKFVNFFIINFRWLYD